MIPFSKVTVGPEEKEALARVMDSGWLAAGPETKAFEEEFAAYVGVKHAIFTNSCTSALKMAYKWAGEQGVTGISYPMNTFCATYSAASEMGLAVYPRSCQHGGIRDNLCLKTLSEFASSAGKHTFLGLTRPVEGSVVARVNIHGNWEKDSLPTLSGKKENDQAQERSSRKRDQTVSILGSTGLCTCGFVGTGGKPRPVNSVVYDNIQWEARTTFNGQTRTESIPELERTGSNSAENATLGLIARVNMSYGSVKDETPCLIEDSAHRIEPNDPLVGKIRCYSFYATKNMTTGSGGMLVTDDDGIYERCRLFWRDGLSASTQDRLNGRQGYEVLAMSGGYDGNDLAAAVGREQLRKLPAFTKRRNELRDYYNSRFGQDWQGNHLYPYFVSDEAEAYRMVAFMAERGVRCGHHYPGTGWNGVSLPIYPLLSDSEAETVADLALSYERERVQ